MKKYVYLRLSIIQLIRKRIYKFLYDYLKQKYSKFIVSLFALKSIIFVEDVVEDFETRHYRKMLKQDLILQLMNQKEHCLKNKIKSNWIKKEEIGGKMMLQFFGSRAKTYIVL